MPTRLLLIEDPSPDRLHFQQELLSLGFEVTVCDDGVQGLSLADPAHQDLVIAGIVVQEKDGLELVTSIRRRHPQLPVAVIGDAGYQLFLDVALRLGACSSWSRPVDTAKIAREIRAVLGGED
jgi:DNA-binding NtrC family response regulator